MVYMSRKFTPAETRYVVVQKEAQAIKWAVLELKYYLLGRSFTFNAPLQCMALPKNTKSRVTRWFLALQDLHFPIQHLATASKGYGLDGQVCLTLYSPTLP